MTTNRKALAKGAIATLTAGAMAMASATPAYAGDRNRGGPSAGEVIAGAVVLGGIAAILASSSNNDRRYRDRDYRGDYDRGSDRDYNRRAERAVEQCVRAAERQAQRWTGSRAEVYEIRDIDRERGGFEVKGRIAVRDGYRDRGYRDRGYRSDYRRNAGNNGWDEGRFTCDWRRGQVVDIDYSGIRGLN